MCCDHSDSFALTRVFSGLLARVNNRMLTPRPLTPICAAHDLVSVQPLGQARAGVGSPRAWALRTWVR